MKTSRQILAEVINITDWLERDRDTPWKARLQRDQRIAADIHVSEKEVYPRVSEWWSQLRTDSASSVNTGKEVADLFHQTSWIVSILGVLSGIGITSTLLHYDGSQPINVLMLLSWLIILPMLFFILSLLLPYLRSNHPIAKLNPGNWVLSLLARRHAPMNRFLSQSHTEYAKDQLFRWRLMLYSQQFGIAMAIAAIGTLITRVTLTDLAFGWSTTLAIEASDITPFIQSLAFPWMHWLPDAVPSATLIEQSHYYRLAADNQQTSAETLARWWQYIAMCLIVYGIGFRLVTWLIVQSRYRSALRNLLLQHPEVTALLDRMDQIESVDRRSVPMITAPTTPAANEVERKISPTDLWLSWNGAMPFGAKSDSNQIANASDETDIPTNLSGKTHITVYTKSWEPPLLEFQDFIQAILHHADAKASIQVIPVSATAEPPDPTDIAIWRSSIESMQQPRVYLR